MKIVSLFLGFFILLNEKIAGEYPYFKRAFNALIYETVHLI